MAIYNVGSAGRLGDFQGFWWQGVYHLYYIQNRGWEHLTTTDMVHFDKLPTAIAGGSEEDQDWQIFTGSILEYSGLFYAFYCGNNARMIARGGSEEVQMRATSTDLINWTKDITWRLPPVTEHYTNVAWRDPYVFWNEEKQEYWMLITAQLKEGPAKSLITERRTGVGCVALFASSDLDHWEERPPLWTPGLYDTTECPDMFRIGEWWYLVFSQYHDVWVTRYRMARRPEGPWLAPADDCFDGRAYYAARTVSDGQRRFLVGWLSPKEGEKDAGKYEWGGSLLVHELVQRPDGSLGTALPKEVEESFNEECSLTPQAEMGTWVIDGGVVTARAQREYCFLRLADMPENCIFKTTIHWTPETRSCGLVLRADEPLNDWYMVSLEPRAGVCKFDRWLRGWDYPWMERPLCTRAASAELMVVVSGSEVVIYVDGTLALSGRAYDLRGGSIGLYVSEGEASFSGCELRGI
ncbi:MAG: hypothetical protein ACYCZF_11935 [Anaerolineae bacterium]